MRNCDALEFFHHSVPFPRVTANDHLKQAASDIMSILLNQPITTVPSLIVGEETTTALHEIAKLLQRVDLIPDFNTIKDSVDKSLPRVPNSKVQNQHHAPLNDLHVIPFDTDEIASPLNSTDSDITPALTLQAPSNLPKNVRFHNVGNHRHNLRSLISSQPTDNYAHAAQHVFNIQIAANHFHTSDDKQETIDLLLNSNDGSV